MAMARRVREEESTSGEGEESPSRSVYKGSRSAIVAVNFGGIKDVAGIRYRTWRKERRNGQPTPSTMHEKQGGASVNACRAVFS